MNLNAMIRKLIVISFFLICFNAHAFSKAKSEFNMGVGFMEGISAKLKFGNNFQFGLSQGFAPGITPFWLTGIELYYHFGKNSKYFEQRTFYLMSGVSTTLFAKGYDPYEQVMIYPRIGKTVNFSARSGINLDMGIGFQSADDIDGYHTSSTFTASIHYFFRF